MIQKQIKYTISALSRYNKSLTTVHLLFCHLAHLLIKEPNIPIEYIKNDWYRIILLTSINYTSPSYKSSIRKLLQHKKLDDQILKYIKENYAEVSNMHKYKLNIIFYYVQSNLDICSNFLLFELLNLKSHEYMRCKLFVDCLILKNNKLNTAYMNLFINNILEANKDQRSLIKLIPGLIESDKIVVLDYNNKSELFIEKALEALMYYAKYTKNINLFKEMLTSKEIKGKFKEFIKSGLNLKEYESINYASVNALNENRGKKTVSEILQEEYELTKDKAEFLKQLEEFINEIKN